VASDLTALDNLIAKIRGARDFLVRAAPAAAAAMGDALRATASAGQTPEGQAWAPKKKGGGKALAGAAAAIKIRAVGTVLIASIGMPEAIHNAGKRNTPARKILPTELPPIVADAIKQSLIETWESEQ